MLTFCIHFATEDDHRLVETRLAKYTCEKNFESP